MYERLSEPELLKGCLERKTQNANEYTCLYLDTLSENLVCLEISVTVAEFNMGSKGTHLFLGKLGLISNAETNKQGRKMCESKKG